jgi:hypothetical protein
MFATRDELREARAARATRRAFIRRAERSLTRMGDALDSAERELDDLAGELDAQEQRFDDALKLIESNLENL